MFFVLGDRTPTQILSLVNDVQMMHAMAFIDVIFQRNLFKYVGDKSVEK
jgi:hypothetical protein